MGKQFVGLKIVPCILHSLPYSRIGKFDGVFFIDASSLTRFFEEPYFRISVPHKIGETTLLHRVAVKKCWKKAKPSAKDLLNHLERPFQLELSIKHLSIRPFVFPLSNSEIAVTKELFRSEMTARTLCNVVGINADEVLKEIALISEKAADVRAKLGSPKN